MEEISVSEMPLQKDIVMTENSVSSQEESIDDKPYASAPLKRIRSFSADGDHNAPIHLCRAGQRSVGSYRTKNTQMDESTLKHSLFSNSQYELSQDITDKQLEVLERKYGGARARRAALTIQLAFRKYRITKRFQDIANACKGERRLTRYSTSTDLSSTEWKTENCVLSCSDEERQQSSSDVSSETFEEEPIISDSLPSQEAAEEDTASADASTTESHNTVSNCEASEQKHKPSVSGVISENYSKGKQLVKTFSVRKNRNVQRKIEYRIGLNLFNKKPKRGILYLIQKSFLEPTPQAVAKFLLLKKGLSKQMIGEYLGDLRNSFNLETLEYFTQELNLAGMQIDEALRKFLSCLRIPGEAQKIEHMMEVFSEQYNRCNPDVASKFHSPDTIFILAFAIIMLNTDLHTPNMKPEKKMKLEDFIKNLRSIDGGHDLDRDLLVGIYERIKANEFQPDSDHVVQVALIEQSIFGKKPNLALPHRRLVSYCRFHEIYDITEKERPGIHQREIFLFNDMLMITKLFNKKDTEVKYIFRKSFPLCGMVVKTFEVCFYPYGIKLSQTADDKVLICLNASTEYERSEFIEDLKECIRETDEMETLRVEEEMEKQKGSKTQESENHDSSAADTKIHPLTKHLKLERDSLSVKRRFTLSKSLPTLCEQLANKPVRRGSTGSLDGGM